MGIISDIKNRMISSDVGIDLGTSSVLVYVKGRGVVLKEPSVAIVNKETDKIVQVGHAAQKMLGRTPDELEAVKPLLDGVINNYDVTLQMVRIYIDRACGTKNLLKPRVMICIPSGATEVEERAVLDAATQAGARQTYLVEEPVAAAIGAGLDINSPNGKMVVDIGGGTTDVAVLSLGGVVVSDSIKIAGDKFDEAIMKYVRETRGVLIGEGTAEKIKIKIGTVYGSHEPKTAEAKGRSIKTGLPETVTVGSNEILTAVAEPLTAIIDAVSRVIARTPPELVSDILVNGIVLTGGGSLIDGLDKMIERVTGIKTVVAANAVDCVVLGTGKLLNDLENRKEGSLKLSKEREKRL